MAGTLIPIFPAECPEPLQQVVLESCSYDSKQRPSFSQLTEIIGNIQL